MPPPAISICRPQTRGKSVCRFPYRVLLSLAFCPFRRRAVRPMRRAAYAAMFDYV
jgi:hypothetical protein